MQRPGDQQAPDHPERCSDDAGKPVETLLVHDFVHRRDRSGRPALDGEAHQSGAQRRGQENDARHHNGHHNGSGIRTDRIVTERRQAPRARRISAGRERGAIYIIGAIVARFLSLTMSAIVSTTVTLPSFFHQCLSPFDSRPISPVLCRIGTVHWLLYSKISPWLTMISAGRSAWGCSGTMPPGWIS